MTPARIAPAVSLVAALFAPMIAHAQEQPAAISVGVSGGSLGIGPEVGYRVSPAIGLRASASFLGVSHNVDVDDINYDGDLKLRSYGANADVYPFRSAFRLSAGFRINHNRVDLVATPSNAVSIGGTTYTPEEIGTLEGKVRARKFSPTFTLGVAKNRSRGLSWSLDAGVMLHGTPHTYDLTATGELSSNPFFQQDLVREQANIEDEVSKYKVYPIAQLSVGYAF